MMTEPYFPLIIYFSHSSIIKTKKHRKSFKKIVSYKMVYSSLFPLFLFMLIHLSYNKTKKSQQQIQYITWYKHGTKVVAKEVEDMDKENLPLQLGNDL
jgi:hypothetical protein